ncbi:MAG: hypothetical protein AAGG51_21255 [Cyanobacteria bacterium P01_G01_bin.54]
MLFWTLYIVALGVVGTTVEVGVDRLRLGKDAIVDLANGGLAGWVIDPADLAGSGSKQGQF